ncbi:MAG: 30S ribosomal protein S6 [Planctomycetales bacterium]|nr:30S ribosomal protein S6 [Planctomycetales bacterium]
MAERVYEGMFLLDFNRHARDPKGVTGKVHEMIEKCGGELLVGRLWAEQKLAYPIGNHRKGTYWLTYFKMDSGKLTELTRAIRLNGDVLRELILTVDPRLVETLVQHAKGAGAAPSSGRLMDDSDDDFDDDDDDASDESAENEAVETAE